MDTEPTKRGSLLLNETGVVVCIKLKHKAEVRAEPSLVIYMRDRPCCTTALICYYTCGFDSEQDSPLVHPLIRPWCNSVINTLSSGVIGP